MSPHQDAGQVTAALERMARADRLLLGCDFDGTISPIVGNPHDARPLPGAISILQALAELPRTDVALVSGRARSDLAQLVGSPSGIVLIGSHGAEWGSDFGETLTDQQRALLRQLVRDTSGIIANEPGCLIERKPASVAVHVRGAERPVAQRVLAAVREGPASRHGVVVIPGKQVLELAVLQVSKAGAVRKLREVFEPSVIGYIGDDRTDEEAFEALGPDDVGIKVGLGATGAGVRVGSPLEVVQLLSTLRKQRRRAQHSGQQ